MDKNISFNRPSYESMSGLGRSGDVAPPKTLTFKNGWVLWEKPVQNHSNDHDHYSTAMRVLSRMSNVEEFWKYWLCVPQPSELLEGKHFVREVANTDGELSHIDTLMLFREGIRPEWEDPANATGGHFQYMFKVNSIPPAQLDEYWNNIVIGIVGGAIQPHELLTGVRLLDKSTVGRNSIIRIEVWFRDFHNTEAVNALKASLEHCMAQRLDGTHGHAPKCEIKSHTS
jgi:translation initiation factor 4E